MADGITKGQILPDEMFLVTPEAGGQATLSFHHSPTVLLTFAANRFTRKASRLYQEQFGIGAMDWRMLVMLTREPGSTVSHAGRTIGIDKAAVSRSLRRLEAKGLAEPSVQNAHKWHLSDAGQALHAKMLAVALDRQRRLLDGLSRDEVEQFSRCLSVFLENLDGLDRLDGA